MRAVSFATVLAVLIAAAGSTTATAWTTCLPILEAVEPIRKTLEPAQVAFVTEK